MSVLGILGGGLLSAGASVYNAHQARRNMKTQMRFEAGQADLNRQFQERMSSTAHQREVEDLKRAGLNPILSANGGSSSPSGSMASAPSNPNSGDLDFEGVSRSVSSAAQYRLEKQRVSNENMLARGELAKKEADAAHARAAATSAEAQAKMTTAMLDTVKPGIALTESTSKLNDASAYNLKLKSSEYQFYGRLYDLADEVVRWIKNGKSATQILNDAKREIERSFADVQNGPERAWNHLKMRFGIMPSGDAPAADVIGSGRGNVSGGANSAKRVKRKLSSGHTGHW